LKRRKAREIALKVLFQVDVARADPAQAMSYLLEEEKVPEEASRFAEEIVRGTLSNLKSIDGYLDELSRDWPLERMGNVDRNVLRMACFELLYREDIPAGVTINEAVELAKVYGDSGSGKFVNGILGSLAQRLGKE